MDLSGRTPVSPLDPCVSGREPSGCEHWNPRDQGRPPSMPRKEGLQGVPGGKRTLPRAIDSTEPGFAGGATFAETSDKQ